jgi:hypothetical protein
MSQTGTSQLFDDFADQCEELELIPLDDGGIFAPSLPGLAEELRALAAALGNATSRAAAGFGVPLGEYPPVSLMSQPARADDQPGLVLRSMTMVPSGEDPAWDAAALLDLPEAIAQLADDLRELEPPNEARSPVAVDPDDIDAFLDTAQHVCSLLDVIAGLVATSATAPREG